jgi:hypothetical protein
MTWVGKFGDTTFEIADNVLGDRTVDILAKRIPLSKTVRLRLDPEMMRRSVIDLPGDYFEVRTESADMADWVFCGQEWRIGDQSGILPAAVLHKGQHVGVLLEGDPSCLAFRTPDGTCTAKFSHLDVELSLRDGVPHAISFELVDE